MITKKWDLECRRPTELLQAHEQNEEASELLKDFKITPTYVGYWFLKKDQLESKLAWNHYLFAGKNTCSIVC